MTSPHEILNPPTLARPVGFSHAVVAAPGRTVYLGGQAAHDAAGTIVGESIAEQFSQAAANVVTALEAAGGGAEHLVSMQIFVTDAAEYRSALSEVSGAYRENFGRHYPAIALFEVQGLFDPTAKVELVCIAVVP
ncbi:MAG: RidA family protein [Actinomycetota bacterium]|nr:RidA family protein [Actinomycetota bacterium]